MRGTAAQTEHPAAPSMEGLADPRDQLGLILAALGAGQSNQAATVPEDTAAAKEVVQPVSAGLDELPVLITVTQAAKVLGISRASAYRYAACDDLPTVRLGGRLYVVTARLRDLLDAA